MYKSFRKQRNAKIIRGDKNMGLIRARNENEIKERKREILSAAKEIVMEQQYAELSLASVAKRISISRPSLYNYYDSPEEIYVDLIIQEYALWEEDMRRCFTRRLSKEAFCRKMADLMWDHMFLLKILAYHASSLESRCSDELLHRYFSEIQPYFRTLSEVLKYEFPDASKQDLDMFRIQFTVYCNSFYIVMKLPERQVRLMQELDQFGDLPPAKEICYEGLLLFAANLEEIK